VLVFLTGWDDIKDLDAALKKNRVLGDAARFRVLLAQGDTVIVHCH
jgi:hypothetical protein